MDLTNSRHRSSLLLLVHTLTDSHQLARERFTPPCTGILKDAFLQFFEFDFAGFWRHRDGIMDCGPQALLCSTG
ncbi:hypothetical protein BDZ45DRAFT_669293 [Acephala macrosclerotiorum]|nr:hypothetical protein BDZ45DRAFT_669293 [Acephala macrosclerotiorum]